MSKIDDTQEFCIGQSTNNLAQNECTDVSGGIRFEFGGGNPWPIRFNKKGETSCQNYHPDYLQNLATSLGYSTYVVDKQRAGNDCSLVWLDENGILQYASGNRALELPYDVTFSGSIGKV